MIVTTCCEATARVVTTNVLVFVPAATVVEAGTVATAVLLLESKTAVFEIAFKLSVTVPVLVAPPTTLVGARDNACNVVG